MPGCISQTRDFFQYQNITNSETETNFNCSHAIHNKHLEKDPYFSKNTDHTNLPLQAINLCN